MYSEYARENESTNYQDTISAQHSRKREPAQQYYEEEPRKYANIPHTNVTNTQRRTQNDEYHNDRLNYHKKRQIPGKQTNSDLVNELTDRFMEVNYIQPVQPTDETTVVYTAPKSRLQFMRPLARDNFDRGNCPTQNRVERSGHRSFPPTAETAFQPSLDFSELRRSEAPKQMAAGDADNRKAANGLNGYQPCTSSGLGFIPKHSELEKHPLYQRKSKEEINVFGDKGNGESITVFNMEEMAGDCVDRNVIEPGQKKQFSKVVDEALLLEKTKSIVVELIDNALEKLKTKRLECKESETSFTGSHSQMKLMKNICFKKIEDELNLLKTLDSFSTEIE